MIRNTVIAAFLALVMWGSAVSGAFAQNLPQGVLLVRPSKIETSAAPGETAITSISVRNGTPSPLSITVTFEDVEPSAVSGTKDDPARLLGDVRGEYSLSEWMSVPRKNFQVSAGENIDIPVSIDIPNGALPGGRYGSAVVTARPAVAVGESGQENLAFETRIAVLYFVRVTGDAREEGELRSFGVIGSRFTRFSGDTSSLTFQIGYENTGDVHLNPYGVITMNGLWGESKKISVEPAAVYPKTTRTREVAYAGDLAPGYYRATLELNRGYQDIVDGSEDWFVVLPGIRSSLIVFVLFLIGLFLLRKSLRLSRNHVS
jgi:hypothetical protein